MIGEPPTGGGRLDALPSPLDSVADSRAAARWIISSAGAVGALLLGAGPLIAAGKVTDWVHATWAGGGLLVSLLGVVWAIWRTSEVLVPPMTTPASLTGPELRGLRERLQAEPWYHFGGYAEDIDGLLRHRRIAAAITGRLPTAPPEERAALREGLAVARRNIVRTDPYLRWLLTTAHAWQVRETLRQARRQTFLASALVVVGAVVFIAATAG
ncbi:hypothetical protein ACIBCL_19840 [Micromonospora zamorensis]|uniref:hypothetical protein n=1 Tax=Micromonospora zamorensis TaxID=709883 RepID=UPI00379AE964